MTDEELIAEARRIAPELPGRPSVITLKYAAELLRQLADRLDGRPAPEALIIARCAGCGGATRSDPEPCPLCDGPVCARCGRCPPCDGDLPDKEE